MPADISQDFWITLCLWAVALGWFLFQAWRGRGPVVGLALAFWTALAMIHLFGGLIQLFPWHQPLTRADTLRGFPLTGYALAGLLAGHMLFTWLAPAHRFGPVRPRPFPPGGVAMAVGTLMVGFVLFFLLGRLIQFLPRGATAVLSNGLNLGVACIGLLWWQFYSWGRRIQAWWIVASILLLPALTLLVQGFLGFGITALCTFGCLLLANYRPRLVVLGLALIGGYLFLSLYPAYLASRTRIREAVWGEQSYEVRVATTMENLQSKWEWFNPVDEEHLAAIEQRLNQNSLVGIARRRIERGVVPLARGETVVDAFLSLIPRAIWPDKPAFAGSRGLVTRYTGIRFGETTSVGIGFVMEFYVNFGESGVVLGFFGIGMLLAFADLSAGRCLMRGQFEGCLLYWAAGQTLLLVGGTLAEVPAAALGAILLCLGITRVVLPGVGADPRAMPLPRLVSPRTAPPQLERTTPGPSPPAPPVTSEPSTPSP